MSKRIAAAACVLTAGLCFSGTTTGATVNGSFESGGTGWLLGGYGAITTAAYGSAPTDGSYQALITTGGTFPDFYAEFFAGVPFGTLDSISGGDATSGTFLFQTLTVAPGDQLTFDYKFLSNDYLPWNDFGFFSTEGTAVLLDNVANCNNASATPFVCEGAAGSYTHTFTTGGVVTIGFGVMDQIDTFFDSGMLIDNVQHIEDSDGDGVINSEDDCPDTPAGEVVNSSGCSVDQSCPCDNAWKNHGQYVSCVAHATEEMVADGIITGAEKGAIVSSSAKSSCGK